MSAPSVNVKGIIKRVLSYIGAKAGKPRTPLVVTTRSTTTSHVKSR